MPRATTWFDLRVGITTLVIVVAAAVLVLTFARVGAMHGRMLTLYTVSNEASRVIKGTPVWLGGQQVGTVREVRFRPVVTDTTERLLIEMQVLSRYAPLIRRNSDVQIRPGASLIGEPVVALTVGTTTAPHVRDGDTLRARAQLAEQPGVVDFAAIGDSMIAAGGEMNRVFAQARSVTTGPIAQLRRRTVLQASAVNRAFDRVSERATHSRGTISLITHDTALRAAVARMTARGDSIRTLLAGGRPALGRFRRDSSLVTATRQLRSDVAALRARIAWARDSTGRTDLALRRQLHRVGVEVDSLADAVQHHPLRYLLP